MLLALIEPVYPKTGNDRHCHLALVSTALAEQHLPWMKHSGESHAVSDVAPLSDAQIGWLQMFQTVVALYAMGSGSWLRAFESCTTSPNFTWHQQSFTLLVFLSDTLAFLRNQTVHRFHEHVHLLPGCAAVGLPLIPGGAQRYRVAIAFSGKAVAVRFTYSGIDRLPALEPISAKVATLAKPGTSAKALKVVRMRCWCAGFRKLCARSRVTSFTASMKITLPLRAEAFLRLQMTMHDSIGEL